MGRPTLLTSETTDRIVRAVRAGHFYSHAAPAMGVSYSSFKRWMDQGDDDHKHQTYDCARTDHSPFREFRASVVRARAQAVIELVMKLNVAAASGNVRAALALLRALAPEEWGDRRTGKAGAGDLRGTGPPVIIELYANDRHPT